MAKYELILGLSGNSTIMTTEEFKSQEYVIKGMEENSRRETSTKFGVREIKRTNSNWVNKIEKAKM